MGKTTAAVETLKTIYTEISNHPSPVQIVYYNNLLYYSIIGNCRENIDDIYKKLTDLLDKDENKVYENAAFKDTIETYQSYKTAVQ
jgi:hypothetical protein